MLLLRDINRWTAGDAEDHLAWATAQGAAQEGWSVEL